MRDLRQMETIRETFGSAGKRGPGQKLGSRHAMRDEVWQKRQREKHQARIGFDEDKIWTVVCVCVGGIMEVLGVET